MRTPDPNNAHRYSRPAVITSLGLVAVVAALIWAIVRPSEEPPGAPAVPQTSSAPPAESPPSAPVVPRFDVARISAEGNTVIAGRAAPGATVDIESNGRPIGSVTADSRGEWVFVPDAPLPPGAHRLTVSMSRPGEPAVAGTGEVLIVVPAGGRDIAGRPERQTARPLAILIPGDDSDAAAVLQKPGDGEVAADAVTVDIVTYDGGRLVMSGRAGRGALVRVFLDDRPIGSIAAGEEGRWSLTVKRLGLTGSHSLRAETTTGDGQSRHFVGRLLLAPPAGPAAGEVRPGNDVLVVEPGQNLWRIARQTYGQGIAYTIIYDANRGRIDDPDLIYPGQTLSLPSRTPPGATR